MFVTGREHGIILKRPRAKRAPRPVTRIFTVSRSSRSPPPVVSQRTLSGNRPIASRGSLISIHKYGPASFIESVDIWEKINEELKSNVAGAFVKPKSSMLEVKHTSLPALA